VLKSIIDYADVFIKPLGFRVKGLAERIESDGQTLPAVYIGSGQHEFINPEETIVYHRVLSGPTKSIEDGLVDDNDIETLTWSMRAVAIFDYSLYCKDSYALEDTVVRNLMAAFKEASEGSLGASLGLSEVNWEPGSSDRGRSAWEDEFSTSYTGQRKIVSVDYDLTLTGFESCFIALGCDDEEIDIIELIQSEYCTDSGDPVTVNVNGTLYDSPAAGTSIDIPVIDGDGATVGTVNAGTSVVIADSAITVNATLYSNLPATDPLTIPVVNSAATQIGTVTPGGDVTIGNMTLDYPDATTQALVIVPGSTTVIPPHWTIQLTGTVASPFTVVSDAWDSSFVCATQTLTGGTISSITINGGAPIATFVGATIPASATIVVTFASSLTQIVLTFN